MAVAFMHIKRGGNSAEFILPFRSCIRPEFIRLQRVQDLLQKPLCDDASITGET
jgi:hypothetical protein